MWTLVSRAGDPKLSTLVQHTAKKATFSERMAILKGINHIGEPCARVLDFRIYFYEMCKSFECNGIRHFLDPESIDVFNALLDKTEGRYTLGVYEELSNYAKRRYARLPESEKETGPAIDTKLIQLNRRKIKSIRECGIKHDVSEDDIDINALVDSIEQRVLEQHYLNNNKSVFYTLDNGLNNFKPLSVFLSDSNYTFWESLQIDQHSCVVSALVLKPEFQAVLSQSQNITKFYLIKKLLVNDQTDFVAVDFTKLSLVLAEHPELQDALTSEEVRLIKIDIMSTHIRSNIEAPSVLNSQNNIRLQSINKPPSRDVTTLLSSSDKLLSVSDVSDMLWNLNLLKPYAKQDNSESLPVSLLQYVIRPRMATQKISVAVNNNNDCRMEDRFHCNTTCIVIHRKTKKSFVGKTLNFSTKGLAVKFDESLDFNANDEVLVTLPSVSRRMNRTVKNQTYSVIEGDGTLLRLKVEGVAKEHQGRQLLSDFLQRYCGQLKASGKTEDILGLTQALRSVVSANHESMPFTYVMDKRTSFIEHLGVGNISISNLEKKDYFDDLQRLASSKMFAEYVKNLYWQLSDEVPEVTGYILLLPSITTRSGKQHMFWVEDLLTLEKQKTGFDFISQLGKVTKPAVLAIRLCQPKPLNDKYFIDEYHHLERVHPVAVDGLSCGDDAIMAYGEVSEITELFKIEQPEFEEELLIEI
ncbi:hypothetical protein KO525_08550 [Psychrosphaera sp. B3R10]|uniref:hypothetical protein n=1 Tax=unclassified Psychrosphaera TaxID=2641570 RepID=UPI001C08D78B|nr:MULTISPECIES: hypothetical protein [unclassified Psychrosphaera]MBU2882559.1 hypothetical protein [Psychrosphaera sp. I2R16]MBU2989423.1 hypothetical protein [Psychrosphaera sp. B3R10]